MGDLIVMTRPTPSRRQLPKGADADILFFTGVRYVRLSDAVVSETGSVTPSRRGRPDQAKVKAEPKNV